MAEIIVYGIGGCDTVKKRCIGLESQGLMLHFMITANCLYPGKKSFRGSCRQGLRSSLIKEVQPGNTGYDELIFTKYFLNK